MLEHRHAEFNQGPSPIRWCTHDFGRSDRDVVYSVKPYSDGYSEGLSPSLHICSQRACSGWPAVRHRPATEPEREVSISPEPINHSLNDAATIPFGPGCACGSGRMRGSDQMAMEMSCWIAASGKRCAKFRLLWCLHVVTLSHLQHVCVIMMLDLSSPSSTRTRLHAGRVKAAALLSSVEKRLKDVIGSPEFGPEFSCWFKYHSRVDDLKHLALIFLLCLCLQWLSNSGARRWRSQLKLGMWFGYFSDGDKGRRRKMGAWKSIFIFRLWSLYCQWV